jgi:hypothetical protein
MFHSPARSRGRKRWQARRDSNPQQAVLETAALPLELLASERELSSADLAFFVIRVLAALAAELGHLELVLLLATILGRHIVPVFADGALERNEAAVALGHDTTPGKDNDRGDGSLTEALPSCQEVMGSAPKLRR